MVSNNKTVNMMGKAYAFFDCRASKEKIEKELSTIREFARVPPLVEISLIERPDKLKGDERIKAIANGFKGLGIRWTMTAAYPGVANKAAAEELEAILNQAYQSHLYGSKEKFRGWVLYKIGRAYHTKVRPPPILARLLGNRPVLAELRLNE